MKTLTLKDGRLEELAGFDVLVMRENIPVAFVAPIADDDGESDKPLDYAVVVVEEPPSEPLTVEEALRLQEVAGAKLGIVTRLYRRLIMREPCDEVKARLQLGKPMPAETGLGVRVEKLREEE